MIEEKWNRDDGGVEQRWWNSGTTMVYKWNSDGETVEQIS